MKELIKKVLINTVAFVLAIWLTVWVVYAVNLTSVSQTAKTWDIITASWINEVNQKLFSDLKNTTIWGLKTYNQWCEISSTTNAYMPTCDSWAHRLCASSWYSTWIIAEVHHATGTSSYNDSSKVEVVCIN